LDKNFSQAHFPTALQLLLQEYAMKNLILTIVKSLVDEIEEVKINEVTGDKTTVFELHVATEDLGKVIGKQGKTARSIRVILNAVATKLKKRAVLEIIEK
jgi:predicted RNA-binding protein YlqC (UPF0109 family)